MEDLFSRLSDRSGNTLSWEADSAANKGDPQGATARLSVVVERDPDEDAIWQEAYGLIELRRRLTETEARYLFRSGQTMTAEQAMVLLGTVAQLVKEYVTDRAALTQLTHELRLVSPSGTANLSASRD